ncbi:MAG: hypothetical protein KGI28_06460 [Thaumarchaeota archaeon]|nr:hypothetical protein [Nitrososphaerota archaeon]
MSTETHSDKKKGERPMYVGWLEMEDKRYRVSLWKNKTTEGEAGHANS